MNAMAKKYFASEEALEAYLAKSCKESGVPRYIKDPQAAAQLAHLYKQQYDFDR